jgi:hypothetical protein
LRLSTLALRLFATFLLLCITALAVPPVLAAPDARRLDPVRLQLKWLHQFQFAGFYAALE